MRGLQERRGWLRGGGREHIGVESSRDAGDPGHAHSLALGSGVPPDQAQAPAGGVVRDGDILHEPAVEPLLLTTVQVSTWREGFLLTRASGFFFRSDRNLFLVTSRHVLFDPASGHLPDTVGFDVHIDARNLALSCPVRLPLYAGGLGLWRQGRDCGGDVDVAVLEVPRNMLPRQTVIHVFAQKHLLSAFASVDVGLPVLLVGFPLGFHDTLHHLPVVRHAIISSSFGLRFQGLGCFLTDGRAHRGSSGAPRGHSSRGPGHSISMEAAWRALVPVRHGRPGHLPRRIAEPKLRLVCRHPDGPD